MINEELLIKLHSLVAPRVTTLSEIQDWIDYFIEEPKVDLSKVRLDRETLRHIYILCLDSPFDKIEANLRVFAANKNLKVGEVFKPVRLAISGKDIALPLFESMEILGRDKCQERIQLCLNLISH